MIVRCLHDFGVALSTALRIPQISRGVGIASDIYLICGLDDILHPSYDLSLAGLRLCEPVSVELTDPEMFWMYRYDQRYLCRICTKRARLFRLSCNAFDIDFSRIMVYNVYELNN